MDLILFLGRLHVLVLHLPIGLLLAVIAADIAGRRAQYSHLQQVVPLLWSLSAFSAIATAALGYLHLTEGGFDPDTARLHRLFGTALAAIAVSLWWLQLRTPPAYIQIRNAGFAVLLLLLVATGHYGGNLTHGATFLSQYAPFGSATSSFDSTDITNRDSAADRIAISATIAATIAATTELASVGLNARPIALDSGLLVVNATAREPITGAQILVLRNYRDRIIELSLPAANVSDETLQLLSEFSALESLRLDNNLITDAGVGYLASLENLKNLNIHGNTGVTDASGQALSEIPALESVYLWGTGFTAMGIDRLKAQRPQLQISSGLSP